MQTRKVPSRERPIDRGRRIAKADSVKLGSDIRIARRSAGRSLKVAASQAGISASQAGRIERAELASLDLDQVARLGAVVGLDIRVHAYPGPDPTMDAGQLAVIGRFRAQLPSVCPIRLEVLLPNARDQRAWDIVIDGLDSAGPTHQGAVPGSSLVADVDSRIVDGQAQLRRMSLKLRDSGEPAML